MKKASLLAATLLLSGSAIAQNDFDLLSAPDTTDFFTQQDRLLREFIVPGSVRLTKEEVDSLLLAKPGSTLNFPSLDAFTGNEDSPLEFSRIPLFAAHSRIRIAGDSLELKKQSDSHHFFLASNASTGIGLAVNLQSGRVHGFASKYGEKLRIEGDIISPLEFEPIAETESGSNFCATEMEAQPIDVLQRLSNPSFASNSAVQSGGIISYEAVVAVDTDSEWLAGFNNDPEEAMDWITDIFLAINVFYERDIETRLLIGDVTLRVGSDPYSVSGDTFGQLNEFGQYWMQNMGAVDRQFAAMFSGRNIGSGSYSGIAWIDQYCEDGFTANGGSATVGSFSYNAIGSSRTPGNTALFVGHEIGHNLGSHHTHCYSPAVDQCYNAESGCYTGNPSCPAGGQGTVMSYCHVGGANGAGCGSSKLEFHPTVQALLEGRLATELTAGCIAPFDDPGPDPAAEFNSSPVAGSTLAFGEFLLGEESDSMPVYVQNLGDANLILSCGLSGPNPGSFNIVSCPSPVNPGGNTDISVNCEPATLGNLSAQLTLTTNDEDESQVNFFLTCQGQQPPEAEFESDPEAGFLFDFGNQLIHTESDPQMIQVDNEGELALTISCGFSGLGAAAFNVVSCPSSIAPESSNDVSFSCEPNSPGTKVATLALTTNDVDEQSVNFSLRCRGEEPLNEDVIFSGNFES